MDLKQTFRAGVCAIAAPGLFVSPASAQAQPISLAPTSEWVLESAPDHCRVSRMFGEGNTSTTLSLDKGLGARELNLSLVSPIVDDPFSPWAWYEFGPAERPNNAKLVLTKTPDGKPLATIYGAAFAPLIEEEPGTFRRDPLSQERFAAIETLSLKLVARHPFFLEVGPMDAPIASLDACMSEKYEQYLVEHELYTVHAEPTASPGTWITSSDYPKQLLMNGASALIEFALLVDDKGTPNFCTINPSGRPQKFDDAICSVLLERARFSPALDKAGKPVPDVWESRIRFQIAK